jgi:hypothetical protein
MSVFSEGLAARPTVSACRQKAQSALIAGLPPIEQIDTAQPQPIFSDAQ